LHDWLELVYRARPYIDGIDESERVETDENGEIVPPRRTVRPDFENASVN